MSIIGWYYLHENGDVIYKRDDDGIVADTRESPFAKHLWPFDPEARDGAWGIVVEALALGARPERVAELAGKWGCDDEDSEFYAKKMGLTLSLDGNAWCATGPGFINLQESVAGFGETKLDAMAGLANAMGLRCGKMWQQTFKDLLTKEVRP